MSYGQILKKSFAITTTQSGLWTLGIFLSSGFNLHWWYLLSWLKQNNLIWNSIVTVAHANLYWFLLLCCIVFAIFLVVFNLVKLWFFVKVHHSLHQERLENNERRCFLCQRLAEHMSVKNIIGRRIIVWRTCLASLITVAATTLTLSGFNYYSHNIEHGFGSALVVLLCLAAILIVISLWNMAIVLLMFWYELSFWRAANLAIDLLFTKAKQIFGFTLVATAIFLFAVSAGSLIISQLPAVFSLLPTLISDNSLLQAGQTAISMVAVGLFLSWLVINNVFFNVAMLVLFDSFIKLQNIGEMESALHAGRQNPHFIIR